MARCGELLETRQDRCDQTCLGDPGVTGNWKTRRKVMAKLEATDKGQNPHFIVTNLAGDKHYLHGDVYCARGDMEREACPYQMLSFEVAAWLKP